MSDELLEPLKAYKSQLKSQFDDNVSALFESLVQQAGLDVAENRASAKVYRAELVTAKTMQAKRSSMSGLRGFLIFVTVASFIALAIGIYLLVIGTALAGGLCLGIGAALAASMLGVILGALNPKIKQLDDLVEQHNAKARAHLDVCNRQMAPLNRLFDTNMTKQLIEKTVPLIKIDDNFNMRRYDYLNGKYGFPISGDKNRSTIGILTGEILGNPFVVDRELITYMGTQVYTGHLVITWTTTYTDSDGNVHTQTHSQTLTASVTKPMPRFRNETRLIYGNEAAPDLSFTHKPTHAEDMSENQLERTVKKGVKKIQRQQNKALKSGTSQFTEMGNEQFDVLFGALDRDNEVQFRLLFTPLAQRNMLDLMTDDETAFGDDFLFAKRRCLNYISSEHSANWDMDTSPSKFMSYDVDIARESFENFNRQYFKSLYFDLAPLLSVPLYQQHKPREYIYGHDYVRNYTAYEAEYAANAIGQDAFKHPLSATRSILKTSLIGKDGKSDHLKITAYSYKTESRVDFVPVFGGDGRMHNVPVYWDEYLPIENTKTVKLKELGYSGNEFERKLESTSLGKVLSKYGNRAYMHGLLCCLVDASDGAFDSAIDAALQ